MYYSINRNGDGAPSTPTSSEVQMPFTCYECEEVTEGQPRAHTERSKPLCDECAADYAQDAQTDHEQAMHGTGDLADRYYNDPSAA